MFVRKKKLIAEIEAMIEDANFWKDRWRDDNWRVNAFNGGIDELETLRYWVKYGKRWRPLHEYLMSPNCQRPSERPNPPSP